MRVLGRDTDGLVLCVDGAGERSVVMTDLVGSVRSGDSVLVHAGVALTRLDEAAA